jgi:hypothetical protein
MVIVSHRVLGEQRQTGAAGPTAGASAASSALAVPAPKQPSAASSPRPARIYPPAVAHIMSSTLSSASAALPSPTAAPVHHAPHQNAVAAFIIGLAIVTLASVLNAAGLNLTKLDHVRVGGVYARAC